MADDKYLALYCRLSKAVNGQVESVERQERWGRTYARTHLPDLPVRVFKDNDLSAFSDDAVRPDYDALRAELRAGRVAAIWSVEQARIEANRKRWVELVAELDDAGIEVLHTDRDGLVRLDEVADIKHILAWHERKRLRERINDTLGDLAKEGRPPSGTSFGYRHERDENRRSWLVVVEEEAEAARWGAEMLLSGWTQKAVAAAWDERRVPTRRGGRPWSANPGRVLKVLTSPTIAGKRVYRGEVIGDGEWDPILDEITWRRLCALAGSRKRARPARRYLLTGFAVCGEDGCDFNLKGMAGRHGRNGGWRRNVYSCHKASGGCGRVQAAAQSLERHVVDALLAHLDSDELRKRIRAGDVYAGERSRLAAEMAAVDGRRRVLAGRWGRREIDDEEWDEARDALAADKARLNDELAAPTCGRGRGRPGGHQGRLGGHDPRRAAPHHAAVRVQGRGWSVRQAWAGVRHLQGASARHRR